MTAFCLVTSVNLGEYSGVQKFMLDLTDFILKNGNEVSVISSRNMIPLLSVKKLKPSASISSEGFVHNLPERRRAPSSAVSSALSFIFTIVATIYQCGRHKVSLIHAQDIFTSGFAGVAAKKLFGIPLIVHAHGPSPYFSSSKSETAQFKKTLAQLLARFVVRNSSLVLTTDNQTRKLISTFAGGVQVQSIPTPIRVNNYSMENGDEQKAKGMYAGSLVLGTIGRLAPQKNLRTLLRVFKAAKDDLADLKLVIVGNGPEKSFLLREVSRLGLNGSVFLVGSVNDNEKMELLNRFDIFVIPSIYEGCPIALLEAMASGKAIVTSDIPAIKEIVRSNIEALLVNPHNEEDLRQAILLLARQPNLRLILGHKARERAKTYDVSAVFDRLIKLYEKLIHSVSKTVLSTVISDPHCN